MVLTKFGKAVSAIVQGLNIVCRPVLHLIGVVFNGVREALHLAVDEAAIRVDYRVRAIKLNRLIKVVNRVLKSTEQVKERTVGKML